MMVNSIFHTYTHVPLSCLTHCDLVIPYGVTDLIHHYFRWWLAIYSVPLSQTMLFFANWILRNALKWNFIHNQNIFIEVNISKTVICKYHPFCSGLKILNVNIMRKLRDAKLLKVDENWDKLYYLSKQWTIWNYEGHTHYSPSLGHWNLWPNWVILCQIL